MSNEKLTAQHLVNEISAKTGETKKDMDLFLRELISLVQEKLLEDKIVKIKGLGTFKLNWNESRKSVNVQTGEEIEIAGHYKVVFTAESELKDMVNEPYAHLETVILDENGEIETPQKEERPDPLKNFSAQAQEIASLISDLKNTNEEQKEEEQPEEVVQIEETPVTDYNIPVTQQLQPEEPVTEEVKEEKPEETKEEKTDTTYNIQINNSNTYQMEEEVNDNAVNTNNTANEEQVPAQEVVVNIDNGTEAVEQEPEKKKKKGCFWKILLILLLILLIAGIVGYFVFPDHCKHYYNKVMGNDNVQTEEVAEPDQEATPDDTTPMPEPVFEEEQAEPVSYQFNPYDYEMDYVIVTKGTRLAWYSTKYYGHYMFWPYIYLANKYRLTDPHDIPVGERIAIPKLPADMVDPCNQQSVDKVNYIKDHLDEYYQ